MNLLEMVILNIKIPSAFSNLEGTVLVLWEKIILTFLFLIVAYILVRLLSSLIFRLYSWRNHQRNKRLLPLIRLIIWVIFISLWIFTIFAPHKELIYATLILIVVVTSTSLINISRSVIGGITLILDKPFKNGDYIRIKDKFGEVISMGLRYTLLKTQEGNEVYVPNYLFTSCDFDTLSQEHGLFPVVAELHMPMHKDLDRIKIAVRNAAKTSTYIHLGMPLEILFDMDLTGDQTRLKVKIIAYPVNNNYASLFHSEIIELSIKCLYEEGAMN